MPKLRYDGPFTNWNAKINSLGVKTVTKYLPEISEIRKDQSTILWNFKTPLIFINSYKKTLIRLYFLIPIIGLSLILLITQFDLLFTIINTILHIALSYSALILFKEYHRCYMRNKILNQIKNIKSGDKNISKSEMEILNYVNSAPINVYKLFQFAFILIIFVISIFILDLNNSSKGSLTLILLIPIYFANNTIALKEKIEFSGHTRIDFLNKQITIEGKLNHNFHEKINIEDIEEICFVDYSPVGEWWSIFSIMFSTKHFRFPVGDFYTKHYNHNIDEIYSLLFNQFKNYKLDYVNLIKMTKREYEENRHTRVSIRVFVE